MELPDVDVELESVPVQVRRETGSKIRLRSIRDSGYFNRRFLAFQPRRLVGFHGQTDFNHQPALGSIF